MSHHSQMSEDNQVQQPLQRQVASKLINDIINDCIPYIEKTAYLEALKASPHLIDKETDPLRFLKYDKWNIWAAAHRTVKYWEWKRTLFGEVRTFCSITDLTGYGALDEHEVAFIRTGFIAILPKDEDGNVYAFINRSRNGGGSNPLFDSFDVAKKCRLTFYSACLGIDYYYDNQDCSVIVENGVKKETGIVILHLISSLPRNPTRDAPDFFNQAMPIRFVRMHVIFYPENTNYFSFERYVIRTFLTLNAPKIAGYTKLSFHYCASPNEAASKLQQYRIPMYCIPAVLGGSWSYDSFDNWFMQALLQQTKPISTDVIQVQQKYVQSTPTNDPYLCESEVVFDQSSCLSLFSGMVLPPNLVEEVSHNSNCGNMEDTNEFINFGEYFGENDMMDELTNDMVPFVNCSDSESNKVSTSHSIDLPLHVQQLATPYERCHNDLVASECGITSDTKNKFSSNCAPDRWSEKFIELCKYREKMGHCLVPQMYTENITLGAWVKRQRYQYKLMVEGKQSYMTQERVKALTDIGFVWDSQGVAWFHLLYELQTFQQKFQHCNVPASYSQNEKLATWVQRQRRHYKLYCENQASTMTPQRIYELEKLGFEWDGLNKKF